MSTPWKFETTIDEVVEAAKGEIKGKTILITGCSPNGLGAETARGFALAKPSLLILAGRNLALLHETEKQVREASPDVRVRLLELDLASQKQVRKAAAEVKAYAEHIDRLINNAGVSFGPYRTSAEGIESQFATNHVGHFLFANLIMEKIIASGPGARIVNLSSRGHLFGPVRFEDVNFQDGKVYDPAQAYGQSKTANILFTVALAARLKNRGIHCFAVHPGSIWTNLLRDIPLEETVKRKWTDQRGNPINEAFTWKTLPQGASTTAVAAFEPRIQDESGSYLQNSQVEKTDVASYAVDKENAETLWELSEKLVGQKFPY